MKKDFSQTYYFGYENSLIKFCIFFYQHIIKNLPENFLNKKKIEREYKKELYIRMIKRSGLNILSEEYYMSLIFLGLFLIFFFFILSVIVLFLSFTLNFFQNSFDNTLLAVGLFLFTIVFAVNYFFFVFSYPNLLQQKREKEIDASLLKVIPYLKITAKDLSLHSIIEIMPSFVKFKEISIEFKKIQYFYNFLGEDINTSIRKAVDTCPSKTLKDLLNDLVNITNSGGDLYAYLIQKEKEYESLFMALENKYFNSLLLYSQIYITLLLISPLFYAIVVSLFGIVEFTSLTQIDVSGGDDFSYLDYMQMIILYFVLIFLYGGFAYIIYLSKPLIYRLKTFKIGK